MRGASIALRLLFFDLFFLDISQFVTLFKVSREQTVSLSLLFTRTGDRSL
ncbi:hypothetical protein CKA32_000365 [Geitlerinema sp. FC II]|nr:hypothetical protein CKA32_000365 [Geitlerinema sp. FC II]